MVSTGPSSRSQKSARSRRRRLDQYFTPKHATWALLQNHRISGLILEPCAGDGAIARELLPFGTVITNDIDPQFSCSTCADATSEEYWAGVGPVDWVVSNPPFGLCAEIVQRAFLAGRRGVAMFLRLSFLEPCKDRSDFLSRNPPAIIVLPRISFTADGRHDTVTCAWFVWDFLSPGTYIKVITREALSQITGPAADHKTRDCALAV